MKNKIYYIQWNCDYLKTWFFECRSKSHWSRNKALKRAARMIGRSGNVSDWRVLEYDKKKRRYKVLHEISTCKPNTEIDERYVRNYNSEEVKRALAEQKALNIKLGIEK